MYKNFVPYQEALALKELGFDEPCFAIYVDKQLQINATYQNHLEFKGWVAAPTFSQAFRWFREKYGMISSVRVYFGEEFFYEIYVNLTHELVSGMYNSYEEAELECLRKLIQIVNEQ